MGILFGLLSPNGKTEKEESITLSHSAFYEVAEVGEKAGLHMSEFLRITRYVETQYTIIKPNDVKKLLEICKKTLDAIQEYTKKHGEILLSHNEQIEYEKFLKEGKMVNKEDFESTIGRLMAFIRLCELALKANKALAIQP